MQTATITQPRERFAESLHSPLTESVARKPPDDSAGVCKRSSGADYQGGRIVKREHRTWQGIAAELVEVRCNEGFHINLRSEGTRLSVMLEEVGGRTAFRHRNQRATTVARASADSMSLIPPGIDVIGHGEDVRFARHLLLDLDISFLTDVLGGNAANQLKPRLMFYEPGVLRLCQLLAEECAVGDVQPDPYGDSLATTLLLGLSRLEGSAQCANERSQLAPWQTRRITEYLEAHLTDDTTLDTLSEMVSLSRSYFCRAFKASTGLPPHQWLMKARVERAKGILVEAKMSLAEVALTVGFADQAHFTRIFSRTVGHSPRAWQRARCSRTQIRATA